MDEIKTIYSNIEDGNYTEAEKLIKDKLNSKFTEKYIEIKKKVYQQLGFKEKKEGE